MIAVEKSRSWPKILAGEIPEEVDIFLIFWEDEASGHIVDFTSCLSTSEPGPLGTKPFVAAEITLPVTASDPARGRTREDLVAVHGIGYQLLAVKLVHDPALAQLFDRLKGDLRDGHCKPKTRKLPTDVVPNEEFVELMKRSA